MKKIFLALLLLIGLNSVSYAEIVSHYDLYSVNNFNLSYIDAILSKDISRDKSFVVFKNDKDHALYYQKPVGEKLNSYYIRCYQHFNTTNIFVASSSFVASKGNDVEKILNKNGIVFNKNQDKQLKQEYQYNFIVYARESALSGLPVVQKRTQWFEDIVNKIDSTLIKDNKEVPQLEYKNDVLDIGLTKLLSDKYSANGFVVDKNVYKLKEKTYKLAHAYEYIIKNNTDKDIIINSVDSDYVINIKDVTADTYIDLDRVDVCAYTGTALAPFTLGISMLACVPDWLRTLRIQTESIPYTHKFPSIYAVHPNEQARILVLRKRTYSEKLNFDITSDGKECKFTF